MNRIYCLDCRLFLKKEKSGLILKMPKVENVFIHGDYYRCPGCGKEVLGDFGEPYSPNYPVTETI